MKKHIFLIIGIISLVLPVFAEPQLISAECFASYYGEAFNGKPTASGELFNMNAYTAAHKTLPFGTLVEVTNLDNGKKVLVRVNDRGPFVGDREIDLSKAAAIAIGMTDRGIARVSLKKIDPSDKAALMAAGESKPVQPSAPIYKFVPSQTDSGSSSNAPMYQFVPSEGGTISEDRPVKTFTYTPNGNQGPALAYQQTQPQPAPTYQNVPTPSYTTESAPQSYEQHQDPAQSHQPQVQQPAPQYQSEPTPVYPYSAPEQSAPAVQSGNSPVYYGEPTYSYEPVSQTIPKYSVPKVYTPTNSRETPGILWRIQLGAFSREENALRLVVELRKLGFEPAYEKTDESVRVVLPGIRPSDLNTVKTALRAGRIYDYIIRQEAW
ncbi:septal ring lytic transglycosylase RlpA family protein [Treponema phagedenis]|uniref:Probable endolytic peptidoglycan transglycosylase RlpA n=1 Tax=Treponema phagedenis TaxID=162 RepID=A0AAE6IUW7_TREPH|nr:septal ring lytic transglycosylase RlpA family protein [Treponema phagedenis]QEJ98794.1 septal ring lytic transglycosylase RlpA family protein [Treponema phagedenis]